MAKAKAKPTEEEPLIERAEHYCRMGEQAAFYMHGLADALEGAGESHKSMVHHLRHHAHELNMGTLEVLYGHKYEPPAS